MNAVLVMVDVITSVSIVQSAATIVLVIQALYLMQTGKTVKVVLDF